ncbi:restriction endonuclease subunit S [Agathobaculum sp.]|uniref:restriction endonuclease subunit S n=1 Tax=Agathobaculum sp. TaxID=2048138 RepID=UPI0039A2236A
MTPEIKQRIEQMCRGEVPEGYKKGKLGIVPEEWNETSFSTLFTSTSEYTDDLDTYPLYSLTIEDGITPKTERYERSHLVKKEDSYKIVRPNDYAYNPMNLRFGAVARHKGDMPVAVSGYYDIFTTVRESDLPFMDSFLTCGPMITYYNRVSTGSLVEKQRVHFSQFLEFVLPLPSINERTKIAAILTTQDKVIELKEKRLAEKQRQKKYLMQQLLTGKKRLPGFSGEWSFLKAKEIFQNVSDKDHNGDLPVLSSTQDKGIVPRDEVDIDIKYDTCSLVNYKKVSKGNFVISLRSFQGGIEYSTYTGLVSPAYTILSSRKEISDEYYKQFFKSTDYINRLNVAVYGIRDGKQVSYEDFGRIRIPYPPIKEQATIAEVLSAADQEIELLHQDIEQEKQKKKALMQLLMMGIVRV